MHSFEDYLITAATDLLQCWSLQGVKEAQIKAISSVTCMQEHYGRLYLSTTSNGVFILEGKVLSS